MTRLSKDELLGFTRILQEHFLLLVEIQKPPSASDLLQDNAVVLPRGVLSTPWRKANSVCPFSP